MNAKTFHLSHGLAVMVTEKAKYLCWQPSDCDRAASGMWAAHTEERLRQNVRLKLITKEIPKTLLGYPIEYVEFDDDEFTDPKDIVIGPPLI